MEVYDLDITIKVLDGGKLIDAALVDVDHEGLMLELSPGRYVMAPFATLATCIHSVALA